MVGLFSAIRVGEVDLPNRIMVSPMCQYSALEGTAQAWHIVHLGSLAISGAGILFLEASAVSAEGRITPGCLGIYSDANVAALRTLVQSLKSVSTIPLGIQLAHAGRKASSNTPWNRGGLIPRDEGGWETFAPSAVGHRPEEIPPTAMSQNDIDKLVEDFVSAATHSVKLGFNAIELHMAHGYLLHQFLSPVSNQRNDQYGGSIENRLRLPLQLFDAVRKVTPSSVALGVRLSATDWVDNGWDVAQSTTLSQALEERGCDFIDVSSGGVAYNQQIRIGPGYQVEFARAIKQNVGIPVIAVGMITEPVQAQQIIVDGDADMVALARGFLANPRWPWTAAIALQGMVNAPRQYWRSLPAEIPDVFGKATFGQR